MFIIKEVYTVDAQTSAGLRPIMTQDDYFPIYTYFSAMLLYLEASNLPNFKLSR